MRVVSVTPLPLESDSRTIKIAASLARFGHDSVVVEMVPSGMPLREQPFTVHRASSGARRLPVLRPDVSVPDADLYYVHGPAAFPPVARRARALGARVVYDAHDFYWSVWRDGRRARAREIAAAVAFDLAERRCVTVAAGCVTVSEGVAAMYRRRTGREFAVVRNVHDQRLDRPSPPLRDRLELPAAARVVVVSGNAKPGLAARHVAAAVALLPADVHAVFLGRGHEPLAQECSTSPAAARLHFPGALPPDEVVPSMRGADAAVVPYVPVSANLRSALPNGLFHALGAGLPVVSPRDLPEARSLVDGFGAGITADPADSRALADAIRPLLESETRTPFVAGAARAAAELTWEREEDRLRAILEPL